MIIFTDFIGVDCSVDGSLAPIITGFVGGQLCDLDAAFCISARAVTQNVVNTAELACRVEVRKSSDKLRLVALQILLSTNNKY